MWFRVYKNNDIQYLCSHDPVKINAFWLAHMLYCFQFSDLFVFFLVLFQTKSVFRLVSIWFLILTRHITGRTDISNTLWHHITSDETSVSIHMLSYMIRFKAIFELIRLYFVVMKCINSTRFQCRSNKPLGNKKKGEIKTPAIRYNLWKWYQFSWQKLR